MNKRRKTDLKESADFAEANHLPNINRAHRDCERECIELRSRVRQLESLLAKISDCMIVALDHGTDSEAYEIIREIDAILPATEGDKND